MNNEEAKWLCFSRPQAPGPFPCCDHLVMSCCLPLTPSQVCSHKQKLFRIHTSWKQRYQHPGCCHEIWECQLTSGAWPGHPALYWALLSTHSSEDSWMRFPARLYSSSCLLPAWIPCALGMSRQVRAAPPGGGRYWAVHVLGCAGCAALPNCARGENLQEAYPVKGGSPY